MNATYQLHQFEDTGYGLEIRHVQPDARQRIRLARLRLHRRYLPRIIASVVAGTVHRHHGLRHHVTPIRTLGFTTRARVHARSYLCSLVPEWKATGSKHPGEQNGEPNRTGTGEPIAGHLLYVFHGPRARRPLPLRTTYGINSGAAILPLSLPRYGRCPQCRINRPRLISSCRIYRTSFRDSWNHRSGMGLILINIWEK